MVAIGTVRARAEQLSRMRAGSAKTHVGQAEGADRIAASLRRRLSAWLAPLLALGLLLAPAPLGPQAGALALELPSWARSASGSRARDLTPSGLGPAAAGSLQEVAPPAGVQQLQQALESRQPRLSILAPADDALLPAGPWTLRLRIEDWPLVDAGPLGLGPHLVVQLDEEAPRRLSNGTAQGQGELEMELPELTPGSHRLTVYAARPWGEAVKAPGAWRQIRVHRVRPNPLTLPATGSPQLLAVAPASAQAGQPVLVDWLLLDAPLQHLRPGDDSWRLRISVNGDSVLVDRQTPLWLKGWRSGDNAIQLELVDLRGEPINPPFNSLVRELRLDPALPRPAWLDRGLNERELALLLGEATAEPEPMAEPEPDAEPEPEPEPLPAPAPEPLAVPSPKPAPEAEPDLEPVQEPEQEPELAQRPVASEAAEPAEPAKPTAPEIPPAAPANSAAELEPGQAEANILKTEAQPQAADEAATPRTPAAAPALAPSARAEVNPDGTLIRSGTAGPLARLRQQLNGHP
jgi:hypothetical protein